VAATSHSEENIVRTPTKLVVLGSLATLAFGTLVPVAASAQQTAYTAAPVTVKSCSLNAGDIVTPYASAIRTSDGLNVAFVNTTGTPVTKIEFVAKYNGQAETVEDAGSFAPNVAVAHDLHAFNDAVYSGGAASCTVSKVDFSDGSSWQAPATNVASAPLTGR
jgi:hypothetical protein